MAEVVLDSGPHYFLRGQYYYRQLGELALNLSSAREIDDTGWLEYLSVTLSITRKLGIRPKGSIAYFLHAFPNAAQRRVAKQFMDENSVRTIERLAALTDSALMRGALTALNWAMPNSKMQAYAPGEFGLALNWVREVADFDAASARVVWREACLELKVGKAE
jgi:hypothetical protein